MNTVAFPILLGTKRFQQQEKKIYYPFVYGLQNQLVEQKINQEILTIVNMLIEEQYRTQNTTEFVEMLGTYEIKTNERNILSINFSNYAIFYQAAHGLTLMKSLTIDVETGEVFQLADLFIAGSDYVEVLSIKVKEQIHERNITLLEPFTQISPNQDFYIADKSLVLYFQLYELTAYVYGFPMFPISVYELKNIIRENGPLGRMATNS
ncbi:DUF3298 and DUF4163 domain-containing protein [Pseudogracilibacillus sp. SO30301A]|uniref:DUF3298 and DUF4163 domain-containing protein n=1 Tax=Pseudogracilibacillus sp. SO30301A TaxID=3098291 RepID=UPI00300E602C